MTDAAAARYDGVPAADVELALGEVQLTLNCSEYIAFLVFSSSFPANKTFFFLYAKCGVTY